MRFIFLILIIFLTNLNLIGDAYFIPNKGQWKENFQYKLDISNGTIFIQGNELRVVLFDAEKKYAQHLGEKSTTPIKYHAFTMNYVGANKSPKHLAAFPSLTYHNYFLSSDTSRWRSKVTLYNEIHYKDLYDGIDLRYYLSDNKLEYDFIVQPNTDYKQIKINYKGVDLIAKDELGNIMIQTSVDYITHSKPYAYQLIEGEKREIKCSFILNENEISFEVGKYDRNKPLIIDPLIFSSYSGSTANNFGFSATYSADGSLYGGGIAFGQGYPLTMGSFDGTFSGSIDVVISKYSPDGSQLRYSTYLGGDEVDYIHSMIENSSGDLLVYGTTSSRNFPVTTGAFDVSFNGGNAFRILRVEAFTNGSDIFVSKFSAGGDRLKASTFIGGTGNDGVNFSSLSLGANDTLRHNYGDQFRGEIFVGEDKNRYYITSSTKSLDFPTTSTAIQKTLQGSQDAIIFCLDSNLKTLVASTYLGGNGKETGNSIKISNSNRNPLFVVGGTTTKNLYPLLPGYKKTYSEGVTDGYVTKLTANLDTVLSFSYVGTPGYDQTYFVDLDKNKNVYIAGQTDSLMPVFNAPFSVVRGSLFIQKYTNDLATLVYSTIFGNGDLKLDLSPSAFLVDVCENVYVSCWGGDLETTTNLMNNMPLTSTAFQTTSDGNSFYLFVLAKDASALKFATYFGGNVSKEHVDGGTSRFDKKGTIYQSVCAGCQGNSDFPTTPSAWSRINGSVGCNNAVLKYRLDILPISNFDVSASEGCTPLTVNYENKSMFSNTFLWDFGNNDTTSRVLNPSRTYTTPGTYTAYLYVQDTECGIIDTFKRVITIREKVSYTLTQPFGRSTCDTAVFDFKANQPVRLVVSTDPTFSNIVYSTAANTNSGRVRIKINGNTKLYVKASNASCSEEKTLDFQYHAFSTNLSCKGLNSYELLVTFPDETQTFNYLIKDGPSGVTKKEIKFNFTLNKDTTIDIKLSIPPGCSENIKIPITVIDINKFSISAAKTQLHSLDETQLFTTVQSNTTFSYSWTPTSVVSNPSIANPKVLKSTKTYNHRLRITDKWGCNYSKAIKILRYETTCKPPFIHLPNTFTPNGDNINDKFYVRGELLETVVLKIYNRWGQLVFETEDKTVGWDGTFQNKKCLQGAYTYYIKGLCQNNEEYISTGNVTLIR